MDFELKNRFWFKKHLKFQYKLFSVYQKLFRSQKCKSFSPHYNLDCQKIFVFIKNLATKSELKSKVNGVSMPLNKRDIRYRENN